MPPAGFEPTFSAGEGPQTYALDLAATGTGTDIYYLLQILAFSAIFSDTNQLEIGHEE